MMPTCMDLITDAFAEIGNQDLGQPPTGEDAAFAFGRLNHIIESFNADELLIVSEQEDLYVLPANSTFVTFGASGTYTVTRPLAIKDANSFSLSATILGTTGTTGTGTSILSDGKDFGALGVKATRDVVYILSGVNVTPGIYRIMAVGAGTTGLALETNPGDNGSAVVYRVLVDPARTPIEVGGDRDWWASLRSRGTTGTPEQAYYNAAFPNGELFLHPVANVDTGLEIFTETQLGQIADMNDDLSLAPTYYDALMYNLAWKIAPAFGRDANVYAGMAARARDMVKRRNQRIPRLSTDCPSMSGRW